MALQTVQGARELDAKLSALDRKVSTAIVRKALRDGAKVIRDVTKTVVPVETGQTLKALKVRSGRSRKKGRVRMKVQIGEGDYVGDTFYASFLEMGYKHRRHGKQHTTTGKFIGKLSKAELGARVEVKGKHFMERGFKMSQAGALATVVSVIEEGIQTAARGKA